MKQREQSVKFWTCLACILVIPLSGLTGCGEESYGGAGFEAEKSDQYETVVINPNHFSGRWRGEITNVRASSSDTEMVTLELSSEGWNTFTGTLTTTEAPPYTLTGSFGVLSDEALSFTLAHSEPLNLECLAWVVVGAAGIEQNLTTMAIGYSGIFCGPGGGELGVSYGSLEREE